MAGGIGTRTDQTLGPWHADVPLHPHERARPGVVVLAGIDERSRVGQDAAEQGVQHRRRALVQGDAERAGEVLEGVVGRAFVVLLRHGPARRALQLAGGPEGAVVLRLLSAVGRRRRRQDADHVGRRGGGQITRRGGRRSGRQQRQGAEAAPQKARASHGPLRDLAHRLSAAALQPRDRDDAANDQRANSLDQWRFWRCFQPPR